MHVIPMIITCMLQGTLCDTGIPRTFYGGNICSVVCKITELQISVCQISMLLEVKLGKFCPLA